MILGKINRGETRVRTSEEITCNKCLKTVLGGITVSDRIFGTDAHHTLVREFKAKYLCGRCRDIERVAKGRLASKTNFNNAH